MISVRGTMEDPDGRALRDSEERYRSVVTAMAEGVIMQDANSVILACNQAAEQLLGLTADQMMGRSSLDPRWRAIHEDGSAFPGDAHPVPVTLQSGRSQRDVVMGVHKPDGSLTWLSINSEPLFRQGETRPYAAVCTFADITQRKLAEDVLRRSEERHRRILDTSLEGVWMIDLEGNTTFSNQRMAEMLGCTPEELGRSQLWDFVDDADRDGVVAQLAERGRGIGELHEFRLRRKDGSHVWTSMATSPITQLDGTTGALAMVRDVTVAHRMEAELRESRERLDLALSAGQLGAWDTVAGGKLAISPQVREILGLAADTPLDERAAYFRYVHPDDREGLATSMQRHFAATASERFVNEYRIVRANGEVRWVRSSGGTFHSPTGETRILGTVNDITESRELQQQLQQASRLEGIGRLAGGVAHDFNNLLTAILASVRFAEMANVPGIDEELTTIRAAAERGAELTRQLLAFARKQVIELAVLDLNAIVGELAKVLRRLVGEDVELTFELGDRLWSLRGGASQLEQVIVNLVVNGSEAMPDGGRLRLVTANVQVGHVNAHVTGQGHAGVPPGDYVMFAVTDAGRGIEDAVLPHIFEPFFTTKPTGTGLGLASAYGIVQQLGGHLGVRTEPGKGSTFTVHLPRTGEQARAASPPIASSPARRSRSTLLLVEDDDLLRRVIVRGLVEAGYQVLVAADGDQALEVAASHAAPIHALITDVVMPRSSGRQLAERFASIRPETKVLFVSGYNDQIIARQNMVEPGQHFLAKPYTMEVLRQRIDELVGASTE